MSTPLIMGLAPMDGVTNIPYRTIVQEVYNQYNKNPHQTLRTWTEFMNADGYMVQPHRLAHHFLHHEKEHNLIVQIYGGTKASLVACAQDLDTKYGHRIAGIELNIGCPSPRVISCGGGSGLMRDHAHALDIIHDISTSVSVPFSIKVRAGLTESDKNDRYDTLLRAGDYCQTVSIHGRTFKQGHSGDNDRDYITRYKQDVGTDTTVIGNGGVTSYQQGLDLAHQHGIDGIMIGQNAIGNPWIFTPHIPTPDDRYDIIMRHMHLVLAYQQRKEQHLPEEYTDSAITHNKLLLHSRKKGGDIGDDTIYDVNNLVRHEYVADLPDHDELQSHAATIADHIDVNARHHGLVEFRKYLFNYIAGLTDSKELKKILARTSDYATMRREIDAFFGR